MSDKFLSSGGSNTNLTNGTATLFGSTIGANNLDPSQPIKTNSVRQLVSSKLDIADINNLDDELKNKDELTFIEDDTHATPIAGRIVIYAKTDGAMYQKDENGIESPLGVSGNFLPLTGGTMTGFINSQSIIPTTTNLYSLGSSLLKFARLWTSEIDSGTGGFITFGTNLITFVSPTETFTASTAINLNTPTLLKNGVAISTATDLNLKLSRDGTLAMTGTLDAGGFKILNVGTPTLGTDAVNKTYSDLFIPKTGGVIITGGLDTSDLAPRTDNTYSLGGNTFRYINLNLSGLIQNVAGVNTINMTTPNQINITTVDLSTTGSFNAISYKKGGLDADIVKLGNSYSPATSTTCGLQLPATLSATGYTTIYGINNMTNSTAGGGVSCIFGSRNLLSATFTGLGEMVYGDRNFQTLNTGNNNIAFGTFNANLMTSGTSNTFLGGFHAQNMTTGSNNICIGQGTTLPATCDHSISLGTSVTGASNQFTFGTGTNFQRFVSGCTTNTVDLGSTTQEFRSLYLGTSITNGAGTNIISLATPNLSLTSSGNISNVTSGNFSVTASGTSTINGLVIATNDSATAGFVRKSGDTMSGKLGIAQFISPGVEPVIYNTSSTNSGLAFFNSDVYLISNGNTNFIVKSGEITIAPVPIKPIINNVTDLGAVGGANSFRTAYVHTSINSGNGNFILNTGGATGNASMTATGTININPTGALTLGGTSATITNDIITPTLPRGTLLSTTNTTNYPIIYTLLNNSQLITFTSNVGSVANIGFTTNANGTLTYTATRTRRVLLTANFSHSPTANTVGTIRHWFTINGAVVAPTSTTTVTSKGTVNADTNIPHDTTLTTIVQLATGAIVQLIGDYNVSINTTVNYRNVSFIATALPD